ncbi:MAG TPA: HAD hydrolase family protein [candidate division Zixibacteria bacterium]|nr:HAD hydrolase family protein [candidate division Zixibacteria bacterium]
MYCRVIACDFDGTGATDGRLAPELLAALEAARMQGVARILVTGRVLEEIESACEQTLPFDAVVAENGAIVWLCRQQRTIQLGEPPPDRFLGQLRARGVPFHTGTVIVGTWEHHTTQLLDLIRRFGLDGQLIFNRGALMLLPSGVNKAVGVRRALEELARSEHNLIAFGDAENDIPLLLAAELGVAARGAVASVTAMADDHLSQPGGAGVAFYIRRLLSNGCTAPTPRRHRIAIGNTPDGDPVLFPASGVNMVISGDPRSGKSWLAGLLAERLIERDYRLCVIDPEGDYLALGQLGKVLTLGRELPLPAAAAIPKVLAHQRLSVVVNLSALPLREQQKYVEELLGALAAARETTGVPHWVLIDEAHYFFADGGCSRQLSSRTGNFILATYRPSQLSDEVYAGVGAHAVTGSKIEDERYFLTKVLQACAPREIDARAALAAVTPGRVGLLLQDADGPRWQVFQPADRVTVHAHHGRKYADTRLPDEKAFRFLYNDEPLVAHNMLEFYKAIQKASPASLRHHLLAGDFSRWIAGVLGDEQLAHGLRKLERMAPAGAIPDREEILAHIDDYYLIGEEQEPG